MAETSNTDLAAILADYVPRAEYEAAITALDELNQSHDAITREHGDATKRRDELEQRVRKSAAREAFAKLASELKIDERFRDDVFDLAKVPMDSDEPDVDGLKKHLSAFLKEKPQYISTEPAKPKTIPAGEGSGRGARVAPGEPELRVNRSDLRNALYMKDNQKRISSASAAGLLVIDDD